ncbi:MAG TPA: Ig domain-containing protein, partial [Prosthecobacter sp.]|nr:Ig domain-containing protein [Prosthecobacter sp.]
QIAKMAQTVAFTLPAKATDEHHLPLIATASSGLPVRYSIVSGPGVITEDCHLACTDAGRITVRAEQPGDARYDGAPAILRSITVICAKPVLNPLELKANRVSEEVSYRLTTTHAATKFSAVGLPPGVILNATTGVISGRPTVAKMKDGEAEPYVVALTASNSTGTSDPLVVSWTILPLDPSFVGTFSGLMAPTETLSANTVSSFTGLGGSVNITTTSTGAFSGKMVIDTTSCAISGKLSGNSGSAVIKRLNAPSLTMNFEISSSDESLAGTVTDGMVQDPIAFSACHNTWSEASKPATALQGVYNTAFELPAELQGQSAYPQGNGYATVKVSAAGLATWSGRLADGTAVTVSTTIGPKGEMPLHIPLYTPAVATTAGAVHGWIQVNPATAQVFGGSLRWKKNAQSASSTTRSYKEGFAAHHLVVIGDRYAGVPVATHPSEGPDSHEAALIFSEGGIEVDGGQLRQPLRLADGCKVVVPTTPAANPAGVKLALNITTGLMSGTFVIKNPVNPKLTRTVSYSGLMIPRLNEGIGHFILQQASDLASPQLSGQALLEVD